MRKKNKYGSGTILVEDFVGKNFRWVNFHGGIWSLAEKKSSLFPDENLTVSNRERVKERERGRERERERERK